MARKIKRNATKMSMGIILAVAVVILILVFVLLRAPKTEEYCTKEGTTSKLSFSEAKNIAQDSDCGKSGQLKESHFCNEGTGTWWIDLNITREGCYPACVINVEMKQAEINWRCTGLLPVP